MYQYLGDPTSQKHIVEKNTTNGLAILEASWRGHEGEELFIQSQSPKDDTSVGIHCHK